MDIPIPPIPLIAGNLQQIPAGANPPVINVQAVNPPPVHAPPLHPAPANPPPANPPPANPPPGGQGTDPNAGINYPNIDFDISLRSFDSSGGVNYAAIGLNAGVSNYEQIVDFKKYRVVAFQMSDGKVALLHIGMAYRAKMTFQIVNSTLTASLGLFGANIGVSNMVGNMSFGLYGLKSSQALSSIPTPSAITPDKIEEYFQSLAIVKNVVLGNSNGSNDPSIDPQIISINPNGHQLDQVLTEYYQSKANGTPLQSGNLLFY